MRIVVIAAALFSLAACTQAARDDVAREAAKEAVRPVLQERFPNQPVDVPVNCIIDNATAGEIISLAADSVTGPTASTAQTVAVIAARPKTITCLATQGLPAFIR